MRGHQHVSQVAGTAAELEGERLRHAGGNAILDVLGSSPAAGGSSPTPTPNVDGGYDRVAASGAEVANTSGTSTSVARVQFAIGGMFAVAVLALIMLHRLGFRFAITVG